MDDRTPLYAQLNYMLNLALRDLGLDGITGPLPTALEAARVALVASGLPWAHLTAPVSTVMREIGDMLDSAPAPTPSPRPITVLHPLRPERPFPEC